MAPKIGTASFAKAVVETAVRETIIRKDVTMRELLSLIPEDSDLEKAAGGVLAWSGWVFVYPAIATTGGTNAAE